MSPRPLLLFLKAKRPTHRVTRTRRDGSSRQIKSAIGNVGTYRSDLDALAKAYIHGHYRTNKKTGEKIWVESYTDKRATKTPGMSFAHDNHRQEHFKQNLAHGRLKEAMHAFHDMDHDAAHKLAADLGLHKGEKHADKKALMRALHGNVLKVQRELQARVAAQEAKAAGKPEPKPQSKPTEPDKAKPAGQTYTSDEVMDFAEKALGPESVFQVLESLPGDGPWPANEVLTTINRVRREGHKAKHKATRDKLMAANGDSPIGLEVNKPGTTQHGLVLPDASEPGKYRNSRWDEHGFYTHSTHETADKALDDLIGDGFTEHAPGSLDRMAQTPEWAKGMGLAAKIQEANRKGGIKAEPKTEPTPDPVDDEDNTLEINGEDVPFAYKVVEAADLAPSVDKADNQYRDRNRAASDEQVAAIAGKLKFKLLADSPLMDYGAPVLANDGKTIIGGNGRSLAIARAYQTGKGDDYKAQLAKRAAKFGADPDAVKAMKQPVLIRVLQQDVDVRQAAIASNEGGGARMSALEQAHVDGERLGDLGDFYADDDGNVNTPGNRPFIRRFLASMPPNQRGAFVASDGELSQEGITRLRNAVLYRAYGDSDTLSRMVESTDPGQRNVLAALTRLAPTVAEASDAISQGQLHDLGISADIVAATAKLAQLRDSKTSVEDHLAQTAMFDDGLSDSGKLILQHMDKHVRSAKQIGQFLKDYYAAVRDLGSPDQGSLFGEAPPSKDQLLRHVYEQAQQGHTQAQQGLF